MKFQINPEVTVTLTKPKLTSTNPKLKPTLLTKDPSIQYRYYGKLWVAATGGNRTMLPASFMQVFFFKFINFNNVSDFNL